MVPPADRDPLPMIATHKEVEKIKLNVVVSSHSKKYFHSASMRFVCECGTIFDVTPKLVHHRQRDFVTRPTTISMTAVGCRVYFGVRVIGGTFFISHRKFMAEPFFPCHTSSSVSFTMTMTTVFLRQGIEKKIEFLKLWHSVPVDGENNFSMPCVADIRFCHFVSMIWFTSRHQ